MVLYERPNKCCVVDCVLQQVLSAASRDVTDMLHLMLFSNLLIGISALPPHTQQEQSLYAWCLQPQQEVETLKQNITQYWLQRTLTSC
jgi:hypothetical protein